MPDPLDPAAAEFRDMATILHNIHAQGGSEGVPMAECGRDDCRKRAAITAYLDRSGLAEARASLEREREYYGALQDEYARLSAERDEAVEARENANALSIRLEGERDRAVERAEAAEADLAVCRQTLERVATFAETSTPPKALLGVMTREALSRLAHSSEEER